MTAGGDVADSGARAGVLLTRAARVQDERGDRRVARLRASSASPRAAPASWNEPISSGTLVELSGCVTTSRRAPEPHDQHPARDADALPMQPLPLDLVKRLRGQVRLAACPAHDHRPKLRVTRRTRATSPRSRATRSRARRHASASRPSSFSSSRRGAGRCPPGIVMSGMVRIRIATRRRPSGVWQAARGVRF